MVIFMVSAYENRDANFWDPFRAGDTLRFVGRFRVEAKTSADAPDALWPVGNKVGVDFEGRAWAPSNRSMSIGDVVAVETPDGRIWYSCQHAGWAAIESPLRQGAR